MEYNPREIERKWQKKWRDSKSYHINNQSNRPKYYVLDMFPYPSGAGLHVGHPLGYIASDIFSRYKRLNGFNVLHPMGYDAFGLPAEQYAIQTGVHPAVSTATNIDRYRKQLDNLGFSFDWDRQVNTSEPEYYKWTQWIFLQLFSHYYDLEADQAVPIEILVNYFETHGNINVKAHSNQDFTFTSAEWNAFSPKKKDEILMNYRLAYRKTSYVWWCEALGTVLANDEVKDGVSERGGHPVVKKAMLQWSLRITAYAERLLNDLDTLEWSDAMKAMQRNWIGKSEGATVFFDIENFDQSLEIFTTRPDTIFGATFMVMAPEHPLVQSITTDSERDSVQNYLKYVQTRSDRDRMAEAKTVTGAFTGAYCIHPFTKKRIPIWIAEYVLLDYGTGAIMAVPSDDERDNAFAKKFGLEIIEVVDKSEFQNAGMQDKVGKMINSEFLNGLDVKSAISAAIEKIDANGLGKRRINYKLRDANFSRQRYWGEPFPIIYAQDGVAYADNQLPLELPDLEDFKPASGAQSPLSRVRDWVELPDGFVRDTDTMPGFAGSSWYYLRYMDANNKEAFASPEALNYWKQVDLYIGGTEHAVGHLMYSRCWHKFLFDLGKVPTIEPYLRLVNQGMIQGRSLFIHIKKEDGTTRKLHIQIQFADDKDRLYKKDYLEIIKSDNRFEGIDIDKDIDWKHDDKNEPFTQLTYEVEKMSKSKYNVVNPDDVVEEYGADCFRMYEMFLGPIEQSKPWDTKSIDGVSRFLRRFWSLYATDNQIVDFDKSEPSKAELKILHTCIKKVREDIEKLSFNTCVSAMMICCNDLKAINCKNYQILSQFALLISPFAPHISEELWEFMGNNTSNVEANYPTVNEAYLVEDSFTYTIAINGKRRGEATFSANATPSEVEKTALEMEIVQKWVEGNAIKKVIVVPNKMVNIVI